MNPTDHIPPLSDDLGELSPEVRTAWDERVAHAFRAALAEEPAGRTRVSIKDTSLGAIADLHGLEWPAFPARVGTCLGRDSALKLLDWRGTQGTPHGRVRHQDEYAEWRVVCQDGRPRAIEMTTELPEYWELLAGIAPDSLLGLVSQFASFPVPASAVFGALDPFSATTSPAQRINAFRENMLANDSENNPEGPISDFNNGRQGLCCMVHRSNNLVSLVRMAVSAAHPYLVRDPVTHRTRFPSGAEAIRGLSAAATDGRHSDPLVVERIVRFVTEGQAVAFDAPIGVGIVDVQRHELAQPDGSDIPPAWFQLSRGLTASDGRARYQRLAFTLPPDADFDLDDVTVRRTGGKLRFGGQLAELVQLALFVQTSPSVDPVDVTPVDVATGLDPAPAFDCDAETSSWAQFLSEVDDGPAR